MLGFGTRRERIGVEGAGKVGVVAESVSIFCSHFQKYWPLSFYKGLIYLIHVAKLWKIKVGCW